jgi:predicted ATPase/class 3 adenylate cyclase
MSDIRKWLEQHELGTYADVFVENDVDLEVLPQVTEQHLEKLGVSLGHRVKMLKAIEKLTAKIAADQAESAGPAHNQIATSDQGERRQLTIMFADLVGSTELSQELDPEDLREGNRAYQDAAKTTIERYGGYVARYMGDGVLAYFGYPQAHEDDAERATRAGLELADSVPKLETPVPLAVRVGIATGPVVVGDLIGEGASQERAVVGETPNLAARLQGEGEANAVLVSEATHSLIRGVFEFDELGERPLKGFAKAQSLWRAVEERQSGSRFEALRSEALGRFVGRRSELALLLDRWESTLAGEGQVVLLGGEPGIGKSRLSEEFRRAADAQPHLTLRYQCSPYHTNSAFYPFIAQLQHAARFEPEDTTDTRLGKLEGLIRLPREQREQALALLAALLSLPTERYAKLELTPSRQKAETIAVLCAELEVLCRGSPVLIHFEDAHWADPTSLDVLDAAVSITQRLPVLYIITHRPEFTSPWSAHGHVTELKLNRLTQRDGTAIIHEVTYGKALPESVIRRILEKADGVPLFVEELTKTVLEAGLLREGATEYLLQGASPELAIPPTLHDSLMARLDRLGSAKEVVQIGAAIGREFPHDLLATVSPFAETELREVLERLIESGLAHRRGEPPNTVYAFKHALVRDTAYGAMLRSKREEVHARIAEVLEERTTTPPEILAHHFSRAALPIRALGYWRVAGEHAVTRSANREAIAYFTEALDRVEFLPAEKRAREEVELRLALGAATIAPKGYASEEVRQAYVRALELSRKLDDIEHLFSSLRGLWNNHLLRAELEEVAELSDELAALANRAGDSIQRLMGHRVVGFTKMALGRYAEAKAQYGLGLALHEPEQQKAYVRLWGEDPGLFCAIYGAWVTDWLGFRAAALDQLEHAISLARELPNRYGQASVMALAALVYQLRGAPEKVLELTEDAISIAQEEGIVQWLAWSKIYRGWAQAEMGNSSDGLELCREGIVEWRGTGARFALPHLLPLLAETLGRDGRPEEALSLLDEAVDIVQRTTYGHLVSELHRQRGMLLYRVGQPGLAEEVFMSAIEVAQAQDAKTLELRAAVPLARLRREAGKNEDAYDLLAPVYNWFSEGFDTLDLVDAKALLEDIGGDQRDD